jgi:hypothetical protein
MAHALNTSYKDNAQSKPQSAILLYLSRIIHYKKQTKKCTSFSRRVTALMVSDLGKVVNKKQVIAA